MFSPQTKSFISLLLSKEFKKIRYVFYLTLILSLSFYAWLFWTIFHDRIKDEKFLSRKKCPSCYGVSLCPLIENRTLRLAGWSKYSPLDIANVKNVFSGSLRGQNIVLKKLARPNELKELDARICKKAGKDEGCEVSTAIEFVPMVSAHELDVYLLKGISDMMTCPSQRLVGLLTKKFKEDVKKKSGRGLSFVGKSHLVTTLMANPEPLIMQVFPQSEGWPFPAYLGACGRLIAVEDCGPPLTEFYSSPWEERVDFAYQILNIAELFTNNEIGFAFYWTDLNYDNLAVNSKGKVVVIDLENIIIVDKAKIHREKTSGWDIPYYSAFDSCPGDGASCVSFSVDDLCTHHTCDFNYYTACRNLLSQFAHEAPRPGGLLHDLPLHIEHRLRPLLTECARPKQLDGRLKMKDRLLQELKDIRNDYL